MVKPRLILGLSFYDNLALHFHHFSNVGEADGIAVKVRTYYLRVLFVELWVSLLSRYKGELKHPHVAAPPKPKAKK